jgi:hypothetical protein
VDFLDGKLTPQSFSKSSLGKSHELVDDLYFGWILTLVVAMTGSFQA